MSAALNQGPTNGLPPHICIRDGQAAEAIGYIWSIATPLVQLGALS
ncbi:MAG: hypothetical protein ABL918_05180 [Chakrabartia sp.]